MNHSWAATSLKGKKTVNTLFIQPYGFIKVHIKNVSPVNSDDGLGIGGPWNGNLSKLYTGTKIDEYLFDRIIANDSVSVSWSLKREGILIQEKEKDTLPPLTTP